MSGAGLICLAVSLQQDRSRRHQCVKGTLSADGTVCRAEKARVVQQRFASDKTEFVRIAGEGCISCHAKCYSEQLAAWSLTDCPG